MEEDNRETPSSKGRAQEDPLIVEGTWAEVDLKVAQ